MSTPNIVQWMADGLPAAYNRVGEIGDYLASLDLGLTFEVGDAEALAERLVWAARHPDALADMARRAREACVRDFSLSAATKELRSWAAAPRHAPDYRPGLARSPFDYEEVPVDSVPEDPLPKPKGFERRLRAGIRRLLKR